jgi:hypothetical protein
LSWADIPILDTLITCHDDDDDDGVVGVDGEPRVYISPADHQALSMVPSSALFTEPYRFGRCGPGTTRFRVGANRVHAGLDEGFEDTVSVTADVTGVLENVFVLPSMTDLPPEWSDMEHCGLSEETMMKLLVADGDQVRYYRNCDNI